MKINLNLLHIVWIYVIKLTNIYRSVNTIDSIFLNTYLFWMLVKSTKSENN